MKKSPGIALCLVVFALVLLAMRPSTPPVRVDASAFQMYHPTVYVVHLTLFPSDLVARPPSLAGDHRLLLGEPGPVLRPGLLVTPKTRSAEVSAQAHGEADAC